MTSAERHLLLTTARVLHALFDRAGDDLDEQDRHDRRALAEALAPFAPDPSRPHRPVAATPVEERHLLFATAGVVRGQAARAPDADEPASAHQRVQRALLGAAPPHPLDITAELDRD